jgi:adenosylmethionine-8-amino-7-oxononanoate aminotransferase
LWHVSFGYNPDFLDGHHVTGSHPSASSLYRRVHRPALELAEELYPFLRGYRIFLCSSGSDAVDAALQFLAIGMSRADQGGLVVASLPGSYHGGTLAGQMINRVHQSLAEMATLPGVSGIMLPDPWADSSAVGSLDNWMDIHAKHLAGVFVEAIQGSAGIRPLPAEYLKRLHLLCKDMGIPLVVDEIVTGMCRVSKLLHTGSLDINPDVVLLGKGLTAGFFPLSLVALSDEFSERILGKLGSNRLRGFTYAGAPLGCAIATQVIRHIRSSAFISTCDKGRAELHRCSTYLSGIPGVSDVRGVGHMMGLVVDPDIVTEVIQRHGNFSEKVASLAIECGLAVHPLECGVIPIVPALNMPAEVIREMSKRLEGLVEKLNDVS